MDSEPKKWRRFEKLVAQVQRELAPNAVVTHNDHIRGYKSEKLRQIDITVKQKIGQYDMLIAIDCKDHRVPVDVNDIEKFIGLIKDIQANKGAMVAANGFTDTAKRIGEKAGLDLYRLVDAEATDWKAYVSIPVLCDFRGIRGFQFKFHPPLSHILPKIAPQDLIEMTIYEENREPIGKVVNLLKGLWDSNKLPSEPGEHRDVILTKDTVLMFCDEKFFEVKITAKLIIEQRFFWGYLPLTQIKGFKDEYTGHLLTPGFTTDWLDFRRVEKSWRRLESVNEIAVKPVLELSALDIFNIQGTH